MPRPARLVPFLALGLGVLALAAPPRALAFRTEAVMEVGHTFAVQGEPDNGGVSLGLSFLWPLEDRFRVGVMVFGDELGDATTPLLGPNGEDLGPTSAGTRYTWGGGFRGEAHPRSAHRVNPFALATWGVYRVQDELRGTTVSDSYAAGVGVGVGALKTLNAQHAVGLLVRGQWLSHGTASSYFAAGLEWRWKWQGGPPANAGAGAGSTAH